MVSTISALTLEIPSLIPLCMIITGHGNTDIPVRKISGQVFESHTTKDLSWFFDDFLGTTGRIDYKMVRLKNKEILIKNKGEFKAPLLIAGMTGDSIFSEKWEDGFEGEKWITPVSGHYSEIKIDPGHKMPELFRLNNNIRKSGIFSRADPFQFAILIYC